MENDPVEIKGLINDINKDFEIYKKANDEKLEKGDTGVAELTQKMEKVNEAMEAKEKRISDMELAIKAGGAGELDKKEQDEKREQYKSVLRKYALGGDKAISHDESKLLKEFPMESKLMSVQSDPDGGYTVMSDTSGRIAKRIFETSDMRQAGAAVQVIGTDALEGFYDDDDVTVGWVGETDSRAKTDTAEIGKWKIEAHEQYALIEATQKVLEDSSINIESWNSEKVGSKFARNENSAFVSGNGVDKPFGFLSYAEASDADVYERGAVGTITSTTAVSLSFDDVYQLVYGLKDGFKNVVMNGHRLTARTLRTLKDSDNQYLWEPSNQVGQPATVAGVPFMQFNDMVAPSAINTYTADDKPLVIADWGEAYQIVDRVGMSLLRDPYTVKGRVQLYYRRRVGGGVVNFDALKVLKIKAS